MMPKKLKSLTVSHWPLLSLWLILLISFFYHPVPSQAFHTSTPTASSEGGFNIQSFQADLFKGSAGAEIPIMAPPAAAGVAPRIVLRYNSGVVDDLIIEDKQQKLQVDWTGLGWSLDTGGFIIRDTKGTTGTNNDTFKLVFNGDTHELIAAGSGRYRTKDETFWLINYVSAGDYWTVKTKDGTVHRFGFSANSRQTGLTFGLNIEVPVTFTYFVDEVTTTGGTAVRYNYFKQSSSYRNRAYDQAVYVDTITYSYSGGALVGTARGTLHPRLQNGLDRHQRHHSHLLPPTFTARRHRSQSRCQFSAEIQYWLRLLYRPRSH